MTDIVTASKDKPEPRLRQAAAASHTTPKSVVRHARDYPPRQFPRFPARRGTLIVNGSEGKTPDHCEEPYQHFVRIDTVWMPTPTARPLSERHDTWNDVAVGLLDRAAAA